MNTPPGARAFTLVELLAVIAILGILAAVIIPTVSAVRSSARRSVCASNLRQLYIAFESYAADNKAQWPEAYNGTGTYPYQLQGYLKSASNSLWGADPEGKAVTMCPAMVARTGYTNAQHYGVNKRLYPNNLITNKILKNSISYPPRTILLGDATFSGTNTDSTINANIGELPGTTRGVIPSVPEHTNGATNLIFCDGHVEYWENAYELVESKYKDLGGSDIWNPVK